MSLPRSLAAVLVCSLSLAGCSHTQLDESIERAHEPRALPAREVKVELGQLSPDGMRALQEQLGRDGYVRIGTMTYTCEDCDRLHRRAAKHAAKAGADVYLVSGATQLGERQTRRRGYVIWGTGTATNPQYSNVTEAKTIYRYAYTVEYWRLE
ncbi:MAG TPA: hypothetical protein VG755_26395 [Nannocystaceae bacterium]|nr:hypothetical protein [Nannocystaceae bacterium]